MASTYFENIDYYEKLIAPVLQNTRPVQDPNATVILANEASDTTICARIRPLSEEERINKHIQGIIPQGDAKALLFEPRVKFNGRPEATVRSPPCAAFQPR